MASQKSQCVETCWAVRVGKWPSNEPYFMLDENLTPMLFTSRRLAAEQCTEDFHTPVKVIISTTGA